MNRKVDRGKGACCHVVIGNNSSCVNSERIERFQKEALFMQLYLLGCVVKIQ